MKNGHLEPWNFGHLGWTNDLAWGAITSPVRDLLVLEVLAWTPGTGIGPVKERPSTSCSRIARPRRSWRRISTRSASQVKGAMALMAAHRFVPVNFTPSPKRRADEDVKAGYDSTNPNAGRVDVAGSGGRGQQPPKPVR